MNIENAVIENVSDRFFSRGGGSRIRWGKKVVISGEEFWLYSARYKLFYVDIQGRTLVELNKNNEGYDFRITQF